MTAARKPTAHTSFFTAHILLRSESCDRAIDKRHNVAVAVYLCCAMATSCFLRSLRSNRGRWWLGLTVPPQRRLHLPFYNRSRGHAASCWLSLCAPTFMHQPCVSSPAEATHYRKRRNRQLHGRHVIASSKRHLLYRQHFDPHTPTLCRPTHGM